MQNGKRSASVNVDLVVSLRQKYGWNQRMLAEKARVSLRTVEYLESGKPIRFRTLSDIAEALNTTGERLIADPTSSSTSAASSFWGRTSELAQLAAAWKAASLQTQVAVVRGEPGIGKTSLVNSFLGSVNSTHLVLRGSCSSIAHDYEAYLPFLDALRLHISEDQTGRAEGAIREFAPVWLTQAGTRYAVSSDNPLEKTQPKWQLRNLLDHLSTSVPLVFFVEDLQWADEATYDLLAYLTVCEKSRNQLFILTCRNPEWLKNPTATTLASALSTKRRLHDINLAVWSHAELLGYLNASLNPNSLSADWSRILLKRTGGSPLLVADSLFELKAKHALVLENGIWREAAELSNLADFVPSTAEALLRARLQTVDTNGRDLLWMAALWGIRFEGSLLGRAAQIGEDSIERNLETFIELGIIEISGSERAMEVLDCQFRHGVYHDCVLRDLDAHPLRRMQLARKLAVQLEAEFREHIELVAADLIRLFETALIHVKAIEYLLDVASSANKFAAFRECMSLTDRGLAWLDYIPKSPTSAKQEIRLLNLRGSCLEALQGYGEPKLKAIFERALALSQELDYSDGVDRALYGLWSFNLLTGDLAAAMSCAQELLSRGSRGISFPSNLLGYATVGLTSLMQGDLQAAIGTYRRGYTFTYHRYESSAFTEYVRDPAILFHSHYARTLCMAGLVDAGLEEALRSVHLAENAKHAEAIAYALSMLAMVHLYRRDATAANSILRKLRNLAEENGLAQESAWGSLLIGWCLWLQGDLQKAIFSIQAGLDQLERTGTVSGKVLATALLAAMFGQAGNIDEAFRWIRTSIQAMDEYNERDSESEVFRIEGDLLFLSSQSENCLGALQKSLLTAERQGARIFELRTLISLVEKFGDQKHLARLSGCVAQLEEGHETFDYIEAKRILNRSLDK